MKLADHNKILLILVPGQMGTGGNELADQSAREGSSHPLTGLEPALSISAKVARGVDHRLDKQENGGTLAVHMWTKAN
jgi:cation transporter-like permease